MSMTTYSALFFHLVWSTKNRAPLIQEAFEESLFRYIGGLARHRKVDAIQMGGMSDHIHLLVRTSPDNHIPNMVRDIKISTTKMIRSKIPGLNAFSWQSGYGAFSVSKSNTDVVQAYIANQKHHHKTKTFEDEMRGLLKVHQIQVDERYLFD